LARGMEPKVDTVVVHFSRLEAMRGRIAELHITSTSSPRRATR
jgi:hypothetical protein